MTVPRFDYLAMRLDDLRQTGALRVMRPAIHRGATIIDVNGNQLINFGSNDYLGLASRSASSITRQLEADQSICCGAGASPLVSGYTELHAELCTLLAEFEDTQAAIVFPSGYAACCGTVATLAEAGDLLLSDQFNHASLIDGCRLSRASRFIYPHRDVASLASLLEQHRVAHARAWVVTDGVFGMDGDVAPLCQLCDLADRYDATVIVDEAHATGVLGNDGSGLCGELGVKSRVLVRIGTLSKAIGAHGGFVVGPQVVMDYLVNRCRSLIFSTAASPLTIAAAIDAIEIIRAQSQRREHLRLLTTSLRSRLAKAFPTATLPTTIPGVPIVPLVLGDNAAALRVSVSLQAMGFFVPAIRPPTVPQGTARLRISLSAAHTVEQVDQLAKSLIEVF